MPLAEAADALDIRLQPWRPLALKTRVKVKQPRQYHGQTGVVEEVLGEHRIDGLGQYGVRMGHDNPVTDFLVNERVWFARRAA